jgi:3,4-dihydroxy 2-butanone 4-phosphate synthase/GTP cyclohydrolase II
MILLTHAKKSIVGLEGFGLRVVGQRPVPGRAAH